MTRRILLALATASLTLATAVQAQPLRPVSGTHLIPRNPAADRPRPKQVVQTSFKVGDTLTVPAFSFVLIGGGLYTTTTTCRYVGENAYIFVEDEVWGTVRVDQARIDALGEAFDRSTPRDPNRGIYDINTELFGDPPDVDGDPRIFIIVLDILDSPFTGTTFVGYFDTNNQTGQAVREMLYIDTNPLDIESELARATLAHEFQHVLHWRGDVDEDKWIDEGCAEYAELACGYKDTTETAGESWLGAPNVRLTVWEDLPFDFDQAYLFTSYLVQRVGESVLRPLVEHDGNGIDGLNAVLADFGELRFDELFFDWSAATWFDGEDNLGYRDIRLGTVARDTIDVASRTTRKARLWGSDFLALNTRGRYDVTLESLGDNAVAAVLLVDAPEEPGRVVISVEAGETEAVSLYGDGLTAVCVTSMSGTGEDYAISFTSHAIDGSSPQAADADRDGDVDFDDFLAFAERFNSVAGRLGFDPTFDYDRNRVVDFLDFLTFASHFGTNF